MDKKFTNRFDMMLNDSEIKARDNARVIVFGVGGVGGSFVHMLARSGIKHIGIVDFDTIDITNVNRQLVAYTDNIGKLKVDELELQLKKINPNIEIKKYPIKFSSETTQKIDWDYDYIVDCIDDISAKKILISIANEKRIPILCAMGAGNRYDEIPNFEIVDIAKTSYDPIAKILRKYCKENGIKHLQVCYTKQKTLKFSCAKIGSVVYYPMNMASVMCAKIMIDLLKGDNNG